MPKHCFTCGYCGVEFYDYLSNRRKSKSGLFFCTVKHRCKYQTQRSIERAPIKEHSICVTCGSEKPIGEFYKDRKCRANGHVQYSCKECVKDTRRQYYDENTDTVIERVKAYQRKNPGHRKAAVTNKSENRSRRLLNTAVKNGTIEKPKACQACGKQGRLHGHHWHGYKHPLDVQWLCPSCHHAAHGRGPKARLAQKKAVRK